MSSLTYGDKDEPLIVELVDVSDKCAVVAARGEVDMQTAPRLDAVLTQTLAGGPKRIVVDLSDTPFIDSTGLGVLIKAAMKLAPAGGSLAVAVGHSHVIRVFEVTGLGEVLEVHPTLEAALGSCESADEGPVQ